MKKILVIEDEHDICDSIKEIVEMAGYEATPASNGAAGLMELMHHHYDLIICDVMMQEMDGFSLLATLKKDPSFVTPFIFLTAKVQANDLRAGMSLGADDYLHKPFKSKDLLAAIETRLFKHEKLNQLQAQKAAMLEKTIELMVGHEFKTPMNGIINFNALIAENASSLNNEKLQSLCSYLQISAERLLTTYGKINTYYNLQKAVHVSALADDNHLDPHHIIDSIKSVMHKQNRTNDLVFHAPTPALFFSTLIHEAVKELIENACKFSEKGTPIIVSITTENLRHKISVTNQTSHTNANALNNYRLFEQHDRASNEQQGLGIGLAISKLITSMHNGRIEFIDTEKNTTETATRSIEAIIYLPIQNLEKI
jgi:two-component system, sensor histidine kinase and response regulator